MNQITLVFISNLTISCPDVEKQRQCVESFYKQLKPRVLLPTLILIDSHPVCDIPDEVELLTSYKWKPGEHLVLFETYKQRLQSISYLRHAKVLMSEGLVSSFHIMLDQVKTPFVFFLEHDWEFLPSIKHSLDMLVDMMCRNKCINKVLFNKKTTNADDPIVHEHTTLPLCLTTRQSNNPHILRIEFARNTVQPMLKPKGCSIHTKVHEYSFKHTHIPSQCQGVECELIEAIQTNRMSPETMGTFLYGGKQQPQTVRHLDGTERTFLNKQ